MWGRLSLRWQVALAVLVPSIVISVLSSMYFPPRQMEIGLHRLKARARAVGLLATEQAGAILAGPESEREERLRRLFLHVEKGGDVAVQGIIEPDGTPHLQGVPPVGMTELQSSEGCTDRLFDTTLVVRCALPQGR